MKKKLTIALTTLIVSVSIFAGGVYAGTQYVEWEGTDDYTEYLDTMDDIEQRSNELGTERGQMIDELLYRQGVIEQHETTIAELNERIEELESDGAATDQSQLEQAEQDMEHVNERSQEVLENLQESFSR